MKIRSGFVLLSMAAVLAAQELPKEPEKRVTKVLRVRSSPQRLAALACFGEVGCRGNDQLNAIVLFGNPISVEGMERTIRELDTLNDTGIDIEVTSYLIAGSAEAIPDTAEVSGDILTPVVKQLKAIFPYNHYQLLGTNLLRSGQKAHASSSGDMRSLTKVSHPMRYAISYDSATIIPGPAASISLSNLLLEAKIPYQVGSTSLQFADVRIQTEAVTLRQGQKVIVGKTNVSDSDMCIFLVLTARLAQ